MADLSPDQQQAVERLKETTIGEWMARGLKFAAAERLVEDLRLLLTTLTAQTQRAEEAERELARIDAVMARRPALDKPTRWENIEFAIATAKRADEAMRERDTLRAERDRLREAVAHTGESNAS